MKTEKHNWREPPKYGLGQRLECGRCGGQPIIIKAEGTGPITIDVTCCGFKETRTLTKEELTFTQVFFPKPEGDEE